MIMKRRDFGLWAVSALALTAIPRFAFADPDDTYTSSDDTDKKGKHKGSHGSGKTHKENPPAPTATTITKNWSIDFKSDEFAEDVWATLWPQHGNASFLIDYKGNWLFSGSFPSQPKLQLPCDTTIGFGIKSAALGGQIIAFSKTLTVTQSGASWQKQGSDPIIGDLWKQIAKGYSWHASSHARPIEPAQPPPPATGPGSGQSDVGSDIEKALLGPIASFF